MSRQRRYQLRHRRAGLCLECSRPAVSDGSFCEVHRRKRNLKNREWQRRKFKRKARYRKAESYKFKGSKEFGLPLARFFRRRRAQKTPCKTNANGA